MFFKEKKEEKKEEIKENEEKVSLEDVFYSLSLIMDKLGIDFDEEKEEEIEEDIEENEEDEEEKENEEVDKRELIREIGGILKGKVDEETWRTVIGKVEKASYNDSLDDKDNEEEDIEENGSELSGHWAHDGRKGQIGGSRPGVRRNKQKLMRSRRLAKTDLFSRKRNSLDEEQRETGIDCLERDEKENSLPVLQAMRGEKMKIAYKTEKQRIEESNKKFYVK